MCWLVGFNRKFLGFFPILFITAFSSCGDYEALNQENPSVLFPEVNFSPSPLPTNSTFPFPSNSIPTTSPTPVSGAVQVRNIIVGDFEFTDQTASYDLTLVFSPRTIVIPTQNLTKRGAE